ncbi:hypothetical protein [Bradyrhizobium sp. WSM2793]|uniref:hypothetical protein n=1 Tax=Bradyrhizobium sp. WSM2793 TaxID=1038866 RepID=UPI0012FB92E6|nr:hypothetical protein [Bradyrhizobium sp. WSM2793]
MANFSSTVSKCFATAAGRLATQHDGIAVNKHYQTAQTLCPKVRAENKTGFRRPQREGSTSRREATGIIFVPVRRANHIR